jgi:AbrB family looped-hinge helix DNA binding protein
MHTPTSDSAGGYHVKVDPAGRIVVPAAVREAHNIHAGDTLLLRAGEHGLELRTYDRLMRDAQDLICAKLPAGRSLSDELIEERRRDAESE